MTRGDFSRFSFESADHFAAVVLQQGQLLTDADLNEQQAIVAHRIATTTFDLTGPTGAPAHNAGFAIRAHGGLTFAPGTASVHIPLGDAVVADKPLLVEFWSSAERGVETRLLVLGTEGRPFITIWVERTGAIVALIETGSAEAASNDLEFVEHAAADATTAVLRSAPDTAAELHHVAVEVHPDGDARLILDGRVVGAAPVKLTTDPRTLSSLDVGYLDEPNDSTETVTLDQLVMFQRPYRADDLHRQQAAAPPAPHDPDLVGWWPLAFVDDGVVPDHGPRQLDGHLSPAESLAPTRAATTIRIGAGRYYVSGLPVTNRVELDLAEQPNAPGTAWPPPHPGWHLAYLDVWERTVTDRERPGLSDPALGGADPSVRLETIAQVRVEAVEGDPRTSTAGVEHLAQRWDQQATARAAFRTVDPVTENAFMRVEVHEPGPVATDYDHAVQCFPGTDPNVIVLREDSDNHLWRPGGAALVFVDHTPSLCRIEACNPGPPSDPAPRLTLVGLPDSTRSSSDLRIAPVGTFKWSLDNASSTAPVHATEIAGTSTQIALDGWGNLRSALRVGDWVELMTRTSVLTQSPLPLAQVTRIDSEPPVVTVDRAIEPAVEGDDNGDVAIIVRWDGNYPMALRSEWQALDNGVEVRFAGGPAGASTYWQCPVRTETDGVEWPAVNGEALLRPAAGPTHARALLAYVHWDGQAETAIDARRVFETAPSWFPGDQAAGPALANASARMAGHEVDLVGGALADDGEPGDGEPPIELPLPPDPTTDPIDDEPAWPTLALVEAGETIDGYASTGLSVAAIPDTPGWQHFGTHGLERPPTALHWIGSHLIALDEGGTISRWNDAARSWEPVNELPPSHRYASGVVDGWLHAIGDRDDTKRFRTHTRAAIDGSGQIETLAPAPTTARNLMVCGHHGQLHAIGGRGSWGRLRHTHLIFVPEAEGPGRWKAGVDLPHGLSESVLLAADDTLLLVGGAHQLLFFFRYATSDVLFLDADADAWKTGPSLHHRRRALGAAAATDALVAAGGRGWFGLKRSSTELFDGGAGWRDWDRLPRRTASPSVALSPSSAIAGRIDGEPELVEAAFPSRLQVVRRNLSGDTSQ